MSKPYYCIVLENEPYIWSNRMFLIHSRSITAIKNELLDFTIKNKIVMDVSETKKIEKLNDSEGWNIIQKIVENDTYFCHSSKIMYVELATIQKYCKRVGKKVLEVFKSPGSTREAVCGQAV